MEKKILFSIFAIFIILIAGCSQNKEQIINEEGLEAPEENIKVCTLEYMPVCGIDGVTYGNKCSANEVEIAYVGECSTENALAEPKICTREYMPVCGADGVTYSNSCNAGNMTIINQGVCEETEAKIKPLTKEECEDKEGKYLMNGNGFEQCYLETSDSGKECSDNFECESFCVAENENATSGICYSDNIISGCHLVLNDGKASMLCA